jgi:cytochrome P450 family 135
MTASPALPPGPRLPALVQTALLFRDPVGFLERCTRRYGPLFTVRLTGFPRYVYVADPLLAREVYAADRTVARAGEGRRDFLAPLVGEHSLLCTEDEEWLRHRRLLGPVFHRKQVDGYAGEIAVIAAAEIERWPLGEPFQLRPRMQNITLEVILRLVFGVSDADRLERFRDVLPRLIDATGGPLLWLVPPFVWTREDNQRRLRRFPNPVRSFLQTRDEVDELIYDEIARRRRDPDESRRDVLSMLLRARDDEGRGMSDLELRDELITLLEAGHETTATGLAWAFERLLRHPHALDRLIAELDEGGEEYLDAVVRETLRSRPVVLDTPRLLNGPLELAGYVIPAGWYVAPAIPTVQGDPRVNPDPGEFRPERFLGDDPPRDGWIPFGGGKRHCVGSHLALLEMRVVIAEVFRRLRLEAGRAEPERQRMHHVTLIPSQRTVVVARERAGRPAPALA